ncbi:MAG: L-lactate dehydrogenase complex protein LldG [Frankiales bacterium]|nr:L-lactate dehydrogenase complex protein LldG [Frankiales bacterium]
MTGARDEVLARVRKALGATAEQPVIPRGYRTAGSAEDLVELLADRLRDYKARVRRCDEASLDETIAAALRDRGVQNLVVPADLARWGTVDEALSTTELDGFDGVLTGATVAVAETGTIVLDGSPDQGRRAITLVPDYHLCVVRVAQVVQTVPEAVARLDPRRPLTWISGPSATSDIELNRVEGVHGPRTLEVILVGPQR